MSTRLLRDDEDDHEATQRLARQTSEWYKTVGKQLGIVSWPQVARHFNVNSSDKHRKAVDAGTPYTDVWQTAFDFSLEAHRFNREARFEDHCRGTLACNPKKDINIPVGPRDGDVVFMEKDCPCGEAHQWMHFFLKDREKWGQRLGFNGRL